jgi:glycoside/pentoside/hexuronide:cation symporter, GPH family
MQKPEKLSLSTKMAYGAGDFGTSLTANILIFFLLPFFTDVAGLRPSIAGGILAVSKIWDAVNDPIVGVLSDRTRTKWGRRRPWMFVSAIPFGLAFLAQWWVPFPNNETALVIYYVAIAILFNTFYTCVNLPYTALTPELTQDYDERTSLNSFRFAFSIVASIISGVSHLAIVGLFADKATGYFVAGLIWSVLSVLPIFWCVWGTREKYSQDELSAEIPFWQQLRIAFSNRPYLYVIGIYICSWLAFQNTATILPYYVTYWMKKPDLVGLTILAVQGTALVMLFVWARISAKIGKKAVYVTGMSVWIGAQVGLYFLQPDQLPLMFI